MDSLRESAISQGDLVFIVHHTKPEKSGWWRKIRRGHSSRGDIIYILECPVHQNFCLDHPSIKQSRVEFGFCAMTDICVKDGIDNDKYSIILDTRGFAATVVVTNDYLLTKEGLAKWTELMSTQYFDSDVKMTPPGDEFLNKLIEKRKHKLGRSRISNLVDNII